LPLQTTAYKNGLRIFREKKQKERKKEREEKAPVQERRQPKKHGIREKEVIRPAAPLFRPSIQF
jgi:hypothetical protein